MTSLQDQVYQLIADLDASKEEIMEEIGPDFLAALASTVSEIAAAEDSGSLEATLSVMFALGYIYA